MDKTLIKQRFAKAVATYEEEAAVQRQIASHMVELMEKYLPEDVHRNVWEIGCGTGMLTRFYLNRFTPEELYLNDLCPEVKPYLEDVLSSKVTFEAGDAEGMLPPLQTSLLVSCSALQWLEEPVSFLARCQDAMTSDAFLAFSMFGEDNMKEMCMLAENTLKYYTLDELKDMLARQGLNVLYSEEERIPLQFDSPLDVLRHLKLTGVTGINRQQWTKGKLESFCRQYKDMFALQDGRVALTYHPVYIIIKK